MRASRVVRRAGRVTAVLAGVALTVVGSLMVPASGDGSSWTMADDGSSWTIVNDDGSSWTVVNGDGSSWTGTDGDGSSWT